MSSLPLKTAQNNQNSADLSRADRLSFVTEEPDPDRLDLGIVIVNWNVRALLEANLRSLERSVGKERVHVIVIDNASSDGSVDYLKPLFPWVTFIANTKNLGFAKACNQGLVITRARHLLLLNPDMLVEPETISSAIRYADAHPEIGVFSAKLLREDGSVIRSVRRFPTFFSQMCVVLKMEKLFPQINRWYHADDVDLTLEQDVDSLRGAFFFIHEKALRVLGGLDERYFIWFEDVDYCRRAIAQGFRVRHVPSIQLHDAIGRSFAQRKLFWKQKQMTTSMITYFSVWQPFWQSLILRIVRLPVLAAAWAHDQFLQKDKI